MADLRIGVLSCSDAGALDQAGDATGRAIIELAEAAGWLVVAYHVCAEDRECIAASLLEMADVEEADVVFTCGGIGLGPRDVTPEATRDVCERDIPGIAERLRASSPPADAMFTRGISAQRGRTIVINLAADESAARASLALLVGSLEDAAATVRGTRPA